jgi:putative SOS response-associated peptidase YedK
MARGSAALGLVPPEQMLIPKRPLTNARADTVHELKSFAEPFRRQRWLIPADGWYEWLQPNDPDGRKIKHLFEVNGGEPFCFAGLHEVRHEPDKEPIRSFTMITTEPTPAAAAIHNRMPVVLEPEVYEAWLDPRTDPMSLKPWLRGWQDELGINVHP